MQAITCEPADHCSFTPHGISLFGTLPSILCYMPSQLALSSIAASSSTHMCCYCIKRIPPPDKYTSSRSASAPVLRRPVPSPLTSHSFYIRAATTAGAEGLPVQLIKVLGRWKPFMHTRHKSGHLETIYLAYITYTSWTVLYSSYMYFCEFFIVITILLLFGFASSLPSFPKRARQDDSVNLGK